ncbi:MAG: hypothetical protein AAF747_03715 [Planctomycetota bacterium]
MLARTKMVLTLAVMALLAAVLTGCAGGARTTGTAAAFGTVPRDFSLGVTVFEAELRPGESLSFEDRARAERPARYVIEADGVLRTAVGDSATPGSFPRITRRLDETQLERVWQLAQTTGVLDGAGRIENVNTFDPRRDRPIAAVYVQADELRRHAALDLATDDAAYRLVDELARLAWIEQRTVDVESVQQTILREQAAGAGER